MSPRHAAAALSLVGWYLMVPPWMVPPWNEPHAPLSHWAIYKTFDTAGNCEKEKNAEVSWASAAAKQGNTAIVHHTQNGDLEFDGTAARCVSTDDPRVKGN